MLIEDKEYKKSMQYLLKWVVIATVAGTVGTVLLQLFMVLLKGVSGVFLSISKMGFEFPWFVWTIAGSLLTGGIIYRLQPHAAGEGLPSYLKSLKEDSGRLPLSETFYKFWAAVFTLGTFGNGGIIGPVGRVAAGIMSSIAVLFQKHGIEKADIRTSAICGLAAIVGAVTHSSIGGGIFAVEIIQKANMRYRDLFPAILASTTAVFLSRLLGFEPLILFIAVQEIAHIQYTPLVLLTAFLGGLLGRMYIKGYESISSAFRRDHYKSLFSKVLIGSVIASVPLWFVNRNLMGMSQELFRGIFERNLIFQQELHVFNGNLPAAMSMVVVLVVLIMLKGIANCITVGSGMSAGFAGPSMLLGLLTGMLIATVFRIPVDNPAYYALLAAGFSSMLASSMNIPIASAVMTIELFGLHYGFPAGLAAVIGFQINRHNTLYDYAAQESWEENND